MVKRYDLNEFDNMQEFEDGGLVFYEDYQKLEIEFDKLKEENKALKQLMHLTETYIW